MKKNRLKTNIPIQHVAKYDHNKPPFIQPIEAAAEVSRLAIHKIIDQQKQRTDKAISLIHLLIPHAERTEIPALQQARDILSKYLAKLE